MAANRSREAGLTAATAVALALGLGGGMAAGQTAPMELPDPMAMQNPMMPNPGAPMGSMSVAPMQPLGGPAAQPTADAGIARDPMYGNLPVGPGLEEVYYTCTACHSAQTFAQQRLTDERWAYLWEWMIAEQGMPDWGAERRETILAYLTTHFSAR